MLWTEQFSRKRGMLLWTGNIWLLMDPKTHMRMDTKTFGKANGVQQMQLNCNTSLYGGIPMNRGLHTHVAGMIPMPQQGGGQGSNHS